MRRDLRVAQILALREEGLTDDEIAEELGIVRSTVRNALVDPDGSKQRARRERYRRTCRCGRKMDGSGGFKASPSLCTDCSHAEERAAKHWTAERVIEAIQRWAREHGAPPVSTDWNHPGRGDGYPALTSVYRTSTNLGAPFASWADAVEAAGFPRPRTGQRPGQMQWSQEAIVEAFRRFVAEEGRLPTCAEWARADPERGYPAANTVAYHFLTWGDAVRAAGFTPRPSRQRARKRERELVPA